MANGIKLKPKTLLMWTVVLAVVVLLVFAMLPKPQPVDMEMIARGALRVTIDEEGETRVRERYQVTAPLTGRILRIELEPGDPVTANETVLVAIQPSVPTFLDARSKAEAEARVKAAEAALGLAHADRDRVKAENEFAQSELVRYRNLAEREIVSKDLLDTYNMRAKTARENLNVADFAARNSRYQLSLAKAALVQPGQESAVVEPIKIHAPVTGVVLRRFHESETMVQSGELLLEVADPASLEIVSDLLSIDAVRVRAGQKVLIDRWGGNSVLEGLVRTVEPHGFTKISALGVEEQRVNVIIDLPPDDPSWRAMGDGYRVEVRIVTWETADVLKIPTGALFRNGEAWAAFVETEGKAVLRELEIGQRNGLEAEVLAGLQKGERVVVHPGDTIVDGVAIRNRTSGI